MGFSEPDPAMPKLLRSCLRRRRLAVLTLGLVVLVNVAAFLHARAFTHYVARGERTGPVTELDRWHKAKVMLTGVTMLRPENPYGPADFDLPFTTHTIAEGDVRLEAWHVPAERSRGLVLLFHGHGGCKCGLLWEADALREIGYSSLLVDFRGSGGSSESVTTIGVFEADDVAAAVDYARGHWPGQRLILYGQSMGAAAILTVVGKFFNQHRQ
jgi:pimeloyl-ACP methyl ester carboxylesterase